MKYFKLSEFETNGQKITNKDIQRNIEALVDNVLDKVRAYYGKAIYVVEGYNPSSEHQGHGIGIAADITTKSKQGNIDIFEYIKTLTFDEVSVVGDYESVHVAYYPINKKTIIEPQVEKEYLSDYIVCLDSGHGSNVAYKKSPDSSLYEWEWAREVKYKLIESIEENKIAACFDVNPEETEPGLTTRANRVNAVYKNNNKKAIYLSIHINASGSDGKWHDANYWSIWTTKGKTEGDVFASYIQKEAERVFKPKGIRVVEEKEANFTVLVKTSTPSVLVENLFQDSKEGVKYLLTEEGKNDCIEVMKEGIKKYLISKK